MTTVLVQHRQAGFEISFGANLELPVEFPRAVSGEDLQRIETRIRREPAQRVSNRPFVRRYLTLLDDMRKPS